MKIQIGLFAIVMMGCADVQQDVVQVSEKQISQSEVRELSDKEYPDNNDIESRSEKWNKFHHRIIQFNRIGENDFTVILLPSNEYSDTLFIENVKLLNWIPTIPAYAAQDPYLEKIGIINAEWNRQQVRLDEGDFRMSKNNEEGKITNRVDLARNCLNAYAWEIITYTEEEGKQKSMYHGWFDFPKEMYRELFDEVNQGILTFEEYKDYLENYTDPLQEEIDFSRIRKVLSEVEVAFNDFRKEFYPQTGARKSKYKNIVYPKNPKTIEEMLNDSTAYSTFQWPGWYDTKDPRTTTLSMLGVPKKVMVREIISNNPTNDTCFEFDITFARNTDSIYLSRIVIGGVKKSDLKQLALNDYNNGYKMPMGIGNHPFYEKDEIAESYTSRDSPYYAFVLNSEGKWVDSHFFGVDGPLLHLDETDPRLLHFWLLSFERHAMVSHLTFSIL